MKSYFDLIPLLKKAHKKQNRMTIFCIVLAVLLITTIFGMADMFIQSQILQAEMEAGAWHYSIRDISDKEATLISARPEVKSTSRYGVLNFSGEQGYTLENKNLVICGSDDSLITQMLVDFIKEGTFPKYDNEALLTENAKDTLKVKVGSQIFVKTPDGITVPYMITGFVSDTSKTMSEDSYGLFLTTNSFRELYSDTESSNLADYDSIFFIQFSNRVNLQKSINSIKDQFNLSNGQISENVKLLGLIGQSNDSFMARSYGVAAVLSILVMLAGILMITNSLNSNIVQRTEFFGMIRCIGATPKQIMKLVRREAISWCIFAIPLGIVIGMIIIWLSCAMLRYLSPEFFENIPTFRISVPSILAGGCIGFLTVIIAAKAPARRASKVSPLVAVSGNANPQYHVKKAVSVSFVKIDIALGIHHARANRKNFILMAASFALSIILFLAFSVTIDFSKRATTPLRPWTPDISIVSPDETCSISPSVLEQIRECSSIKRAYGRMFSYGLPVSVNGVDSAIDLISYEHYQLEWAEEYLIDGSIQEIQKNDFTGLIVYEPESKIQVGDTVSINIDGNITNINIVGMLSTCPFDNAPDVGTVICSENTFYQLTKQRDYTIIDLQLLDNTTNDDIRTLRQLTGTEYTFSDKRLANQSVMGTYYSMVIFIYGFLILIAFISIFNIMNSVSMSVITHMKQYGVFRAIGLSTRQLSRMIIAEAMAYAITGCFCGCALGIPLNKFLFTKQITYQWNDTWTIPFAELAIILAIIVISVFYAVRNPLKRIHKMSIIDTINSE